MAIEIKVTLSETDNATWTANTLHRIADALDGRTSPLALPAAPAAALPPPVAMAAGERAAAAKAAPKAPEAAAAAEQPVKRGPGRPKKAPPPPPPEEEEEEEAGDDDDDRGTPFQANRNASEPTGDEEEEAEEEEEEDADLTPPKPAPKAPKALPVDMDRDVIPAFQFLNESQGEIGLALGKKILAHFGVKKIRQLPEESWAAALKAAKTGKLPKLGA